MIEPIKGCRVCGQNELHIVRDFGNIALSNFGEKELKPIYFPLEVVYCGKCTLLQLNHTAPFDLMYSEHYWYKSNVNPVIVQNLKEIAEQAQAMINLKSEDYFIDIGANDGTLLSFVKNCKRIGIEPSNNNLKELQQYCDYAYNGFWEKFSSQDIKAKVITAIAVIYDLEDPNWFIKNVKQHLHEDGVFIAQLMPLSQMIENFDVGNICHEHLEYYSWNSLVYLFEQNGLEIFKVEVNGVNGGSYKIFARHYKEGSLKMPEKSYNLDDYHNFFNVIDINKNLLVDFLRKSKETGKKVYGYGASTKGNMILQYYGITQDLLLGILERNEGKIGKFTVATQIPILPESVKEDADFLWILPWGFVEYFKEREQEWIKKGGVFVVSTPIFRKC